MKFKKIKMITSVITTVMICSLFNINVVKADITDTALEGYYATNPNQSVGKSKTIKIDGDFSDWSEDMKIAQGVANDDPRIFRGSHEGPVYDTYALYSAWDDENLYFMWQYTNVTDVVDPSQGYPISDNGKPWNGDIPIMLALNTGTGNTSDGTASDGKSVWGLNVKFNTAVDKILCFSAKPKVGKPAIFSVVDGKFDYDSAVDFRDAGVSYVYGDGFLGSSMYGIKGNGYEGYKPEDLLNPSSNWVDFLTKGHDTKQDTMYEMVIPLKSLGIDKSYIEKNGIGAMLISTFGASGTGSIPMDMTFLDNATTPYSADASTSAEKEDVERVSVPLARVGNIVNTQDKLSIIKVTTSVNSPQKVGSSILFDTVATSKMGALQYKYEVNGQVLKDYSVSSKFNWTPSKAGTYKIKVTVKDSVGNTDSKIMDYVIEDKVVDSTVTRVEENASTIKYTGSWITNNGSKYSDGKIFETKEMGAKAVFKFNGTGIKLISSVGNNRGIAKVIVDGVVYPADMCRAISQDGVVTFQKLDLAYGEHTITVECSGLKSKKSSGTSISIDAFDVVKNN